MSNVLRPAGIIKKTNCKKHSFLERARAESWKLDSKK
jgi:hypothetical protein